MLSSSSETKYPTGGESQNANYLMLVYVFFSFYLFLLPLSIVLKFKNPFMRSSVNCYPCSHSTGLKSDLDSLLCSWKSLLFAVEKNRYWGCGYRIFITFGGCISGADVNWQPGLVIWDTWALFGINSLKCKIILAARQVDLCYKITF